MNKKDLTTIINTHPEHKFTERDMTLFIQYAEYLDNWKARAMEKFIKGRAEHNESIMSIRCDYEINQELMDITAYNFIRSLQ